MIMESLKKAIGSTVPSRRYTPDLVSQGDTGFRRTRYSAVVELALARTWLCSNWRIFQQQSVPQILDTVLKAHGLNDFEQRLSYDHQPRKYSVQTGELRSRNRSKARSTASPIGVTPLASNTSGKYPSAVVKSVWTLTGPKVTTANSTRFAAIASAYNSSLKNSNASFNCWIGAPLMDDDVSNSNMQGHRCSGFSANSATAKGCCSKLTQDDTYRPPLNICP